MSPILPRILQDARNRQLEVILEHQLTKRFIKADVKVLVKWAGTPREEATWEYFDNL